ncbi:hypothetical protein ACFQFC_21045 [Amorphoplanes digitatis]|uniref:Uncharacterized protein n=1 Tax=Actinoplanes digitatis TaxID=1868 RepID=A0A7W7I597_9ACTN|nr:hypothetical protein [Actinoplanes digitatis]MBB4766706.1 hypothetical protein [Actinoplanes digitatis]GID96689.1 hypothetical protein Adi01nite_61010 [Actinoplanes digitatis]
MRTLTLAGEALAVLVVLTGSIHAPYARVPDPPTDPGAAVLQVKEWRSLVGPSEQAEIPEVTILGGGRVIVPAGQDGALQRATEHTLTPDEYRYVYRLAHQAGLARNRHYSSPIEATDGSLLVVTLRSGGRTYTTTVTSPWAGEAGPRGRIVGFRRALNALVAAEATTPYRPAEYAALVTGGFGSREDRAARPWPGGTELLPGVRTYVGMCTPLTSVPPEATGTALWASGREILWVTLRPLLPHERACADLDRGTP